MIQQNTRAILSFMALAISSNLFAADLNQGSTPPIFLTIE